MSFVIYKMAPAGSDCERWYLTSLPNDENPLSGIVYRGQKAADGVPSAAGEAPTEEDAKKICEYLRTASYGPPEEHFYEKAPAEVTL